MDNYSTPEVAVRLLHCLECDEAWLDPGERWRAYVSDDSELLVYCTACANREFGPGSAYPAS